MSRRLPEGALENAMLLYRRGLTINQVAAATGISIPYLKTSVRSRGIGRPSGFQPGNASRTGVEHSVATIQKMRAACVGRRPSREAIEKSHRGHLRDPMEQLYSHYRRQGITTRGLDFTLSLAQFSALAQSDCAYCGAIPSAKLSTPLVVNGVDRIDNSGGYVLGNCCAACRTCNRMKLAMPVEVFLERCRRIVVVAGSAFSGWSFDAGVEPIEPIVPRRRVANGDWLGHLMRRYQRRVIRSERAFTLTRNQFGQILSSPCVYCGGESESRKTLGGRCVSEVDRVDNTRGYVPGNCLAACRRCNLMKMGLTGPVFVAHCQRVAEHTICTKD